jgi:tetratricopeptide (TPR) repeat protein
MNAVEEDGADAAINAYRRAWTSRNEPPGAEAALNLAGYTLLFGGRAAEGLKLLALNAEAFPNSANVYDSLADAYLAVGEKEKAVELAKKAAVLLEADTTLTPERRAAIKGSIEAKLKTN